MNLVFGVPYAGIQLLQMSNLVPGMKQTVARTVAESEPAGRSEVFGWMKAEDIARYKGAADAAVRSLRVEKRREIGDGIRGGGITDERQLREAAGRMRQP